MTDWTKCGFPVLVECTSTVIGHFNCGTIYKAVGYHERDRLLGIEVSGKTSWNAASNFKWWTAVPETQPPRPDTSSHYANDPDQGAFG